LRLWVFGESQNEIDARLLVGPIQLVRCRRGAAQIETVEAMGGHELKSVFQELVCRLGVQGEDSGSIEE